MDFQESIKVIASQFGVDDLEPDEDGLVRLEYDGRITLTVFSPPESEALYLAASLMEIPSPPNNAFLERLLKMNFLLLDTRGATLSIDDDSRQVHLCLCLPSEVFDAQSLPQLIESFLEVGVQLQAELAADATALSGTSGVPDTRLPSMQRI